MVGDIELSNYISALCKSLLLTLKNAEEEELKFLIGEVIIELEVKAEQKLNQDGNLEFKVLGVGFGADAAREAAHGSTQRLTLKLTPEFRGEREPPGGW